MTIRFHMVAIDLDGTLLNSAKEVTDATVAILRTARQEAGVHIVLATARPPRSVMPTYNLLELDTPMINYNGALVYEPSSRRILLHRPLAAKIVRGIVTLARKLCPEVVVSGELLDRWFTDRVDSRYQTETARLTGPDVVAPLESWLDQDLTKLLLLGQAAQLKIIAQAIHKQYPHQVQVLQTEDDLIQITHATVSKAQALRTVAAEMTVQREQVMAIGDNANDVGMLQWAGVAVAMGNAAPQALSVADHVADHHDADGAANAIRRIILEGKIPKSVRTAPRHRGRPKNSGW
ncbi:MAG: Cof-type HAD-IIB family hydrolase [Planctomycetota bacterium]|nr:Cof-type HAD-IIB family hydrolase [Planctomycetota bacterium]